jgi:ribonuclease D
LFAGGSGLRRRQGVVDQRLLLRLVQGIAADRRRRRTRSTNVAQALAGGQREGLALLEGWRRETFGNDALAVVEGRVAVRVEDGRLRIETI